jgi:hypothetical protein
MPPKVSKVDAALAKAAKAKRVSQGPPAVAKVKVQEIAAPTVPPQLQQPQKVEVAYLPVPAPAHEVSFFTSAFDGYSRALREFNESLFPAAVYDPWPPSATASSSTSLRTSTPCWDGGGSLLTLKIPVQALPSSPPQSGGVKFMSAVSGFFGVDDGFLKRKQEQQAEMQRALGATIRFVPFSPHSSALSVCARCTVAAAQVAEAKARKEEEKRRQREEEARFMKQVSVRGLLSGVFPASLEVSLREFANSSSNLLFTIHQRRRLHKL